jgi:hypothetical protein
MNVQRDINREIYDKECIEYVQWMALEHVQPIDGVDLIKIQENAARIEVVV